MKAPYTMCGKRGDTVFQRNRYGQISYKAFIPHNPRSSGQNFVRSNFGSVSARWRTLLEEQRLKWCARATTQQTRSRLGKRYPMRGFYYFVRVNVTLANRGLPQVDLPPEDNAQAKPSAPLLSQILVGYDKGLVKQGSSRTAPVPSLHSHLERLNAPSIPQSAFRIPHSDG